MPDLRFGDGDHTRAGARGTSWQDLEGGGRQGVGRSARGWHIRGAGGHIATRDQIISAKWVYSWKSDEFGNVVRATARLVARGFGQVDDIFAIGRKSRCDKFGDDLDASVPITNLGELRWHAGCRFERDRVAGTVKISQQASAEKIVAKFGVTRGKPTPMVVGLRLDEFDQEEAKVEEPFRSLVGHPMWLANQTRHDILNAVRAVARYSHSPIFVHWKAALRIIQYIRLTSGHGITFQRGMGSGVDLELYMDSDFASRDTNRRFVSGGVVMCAGACESLFSRTQKSVTLYSAEAEYVALAAGVKETIFLRYIWSFIFPDRDVECTLVKEGNVGAIHLAKKLGDHAQLEAHRHSPPFYSGACSKRRIQGSL